MATDKVGTRTIEQFMSDYVPVYQPIYPLFMGKSQAYSEFNGVQNFRRVETVGQIRAQHVTPKDSELRQVNASEKTKSFKKYFLANQFITSTMQDADGDDDVIKQVLDEHNTQFDEMFLLGEGTSTSSMVNNSLFWSNDTNYVLETSAEVAKDANSNYLIDLHAKVMTSVAKSDRIAGRKLIIFYGTLALPLFTGLFANVAKPFKAVLNESLGAGYSTASLPSVITPANTNGFIIANLDQLKLHYTKMPALINSGTDEQNMKNWYNFLMGSCSLEVLASGAVIRQPITLAA